MSDSLATLNARLGEVVDLRHTAALLEWDERVCMPAGGVTAHGNMLATVRRLAHEQFTSDDIGRLIEQAKAELNGAGPDSEAHRQVAAIARDYVKATRVPGDYVAELARVSSTAHEAWQEARNRADFSIFAPHLAALVELKQRYIEFFTPLDHPYDALLDDFEPGATTADVQRVFDGLRPELVGLLQAIGRRPIPDDSALHHHYAERDMVEFAVGAASAFGFDWSRGRQDKSSHPFATSIGIDDVRITTRYNERHPFETLFSVMHETGHALYEQGIAARWRRTILEAGASLGVHESQSRLWENIIGRSRAFWSHFFPAVQQRFPSQLDGVTVDAFYRAINKVHPSLIRVEADEVTYNLHVMLRVEIEIAMLNGEARVADLPEIWGDKMQQYLGVGPTSVANGVLQDMHWSIGLFGYFATYTLGNVISVQLWDAFRKAVPDHETQVRNGQFSALREWLRTHVHQYGRSYQPGEIVRRATGSNVDPAPYLRYLKDKYRDVYGLTA